MVSVSTLSTQWRRGLTAWNNDHASPNRHTTRQVFYLKYLKANIYSFLLQMNSSDRYSSDDVKGATSKEMVNIQYLQYTFLNFACMAALNDCISSCREFSFDLIWCRWWLLTSRGRKDNTPRRRHRRPPLRLHKKAFHGWANLTKLGGSMAHKRVIGQHSRLRTIAGVAKQTTNRSWWS